MTDYLIRECEAYVEKENELRKMEEKLKSDWSHQFVMLNNRKEELEKELEKQENSSNEKLGNACVFIEQIDGKENLMEMFLNLLNQNMGILDVLMRCKNFAYLKNCKKIYGNMTA